MEPDSSTSSNSNPNQVGEQISLADAIAWTNTYQLASSNEPQSVFFSASVFTELLGQSGATGIRIYNATNSDGQRCVVLVGATEEQDLADENSIIYDRGKICPPYCIVSPLSHS